MQESVRFMEHATHAIQLLGKCLTSYGDEEKFSAAQDEFAACHCPYTPDSTFTVQKHSQVHFLTCITCFFGAEWSQPRELGRLKFWFSHHHHHLEHAPAWSVAVSTVGFHRSRSWARCQADAKPMLSGRKSCSMVRSQVRRGRPGGRFQSRGSPEIMDRRARVWSILLSALAIWLKKRRRLSRRVVDSCVWHVRRSTYKEYRWPRSYLYSLVFPHGFSARRQTKVRKVMWIFFRFMQTDYFLLQWSFCCWHLTALVLGAL